jgi:hypothetical protein
MSNSYFIVSYGILESRVYYEILLDICNYISNDGKNYTYRLSPDATIFHTAHPITPDTLTYLSMKYDVKIIRRDFKEYG